MKKAFLFSIITLFFLLSSCAFITESGCQHVEIIDEGIKPTCFTSGVSNGKHCSVCNEVLVRQIELPPLEHQLQIEGYVPSSCTKTSATGTAICTLCNSIVYEQSFIEPTGHNYVDGKCINCNCEKIDYTDLSRYESHEGEAYFSTYPNGSAMRMLYNDMDNALTSFHTNPNIDAYFYCNNNELGNLYTVGVFNYNKYSLTLEEAQTVYVLYRKDHPAFYWMSYWLYWTNSSIIVTTVEEYADGHSRASYNQKMYEEIEKYTSLAEGETSPYNITLTYYEAIVNNNSYAYDKYGDIESAQWAHSIMGDFLYDKFVCEGYSKLFQLLLNYSGVENMYICGDANGSHLWNLVRMDDGNWYWFDPTWGDTTQDYYKYFCALDSTMTTHFPTPSNQHGMYFNITLPQRAENYNGLSKLLKVNDEFTVDGRTYCRLSSNQVSQIQGERTSGYNVAYNGRVYKIVD